MLRGFTIVELITVIILLGVLSAVAFGRLGSNNAFEPAILAQLVDEELRLAQKLATARQDSQITFTLSGDANQWQTQTFSDIAGVLRSQNTSRNNSSVNITNGIANTTLGSGDSLSVELDGLGNVRAVLLAGVAGDPGTSVQISIGGDSNRQLCIYPTGYVAHANCS